MRDWQAYVRSHLSLPELTPEREARIVRELAGQFEDFYRDARASGMSDPDADAHACSQITDWTAIARDVRRAGTRHHRPRLERLANRFDAAPGRTGGLQQMFAHFLRDVRLACRQFAKTPGFSVIAIATLALGIGSTTAIFSVVNGVLLRPLPYPEPDALVRVHETLPQYGRFSVAPATFLDWRNQNGVFERLAAYTGTSGTFAWPDGPERVTGIAVSWDMFDLLRVSPELGSGFAANQEQAGASDVIMLSHGFWQRRFDSDPNVVGRSVTVDGAPVTVVGVMPAGFHFPVRGRDYWQPMPLNPATAPRGAHYISVVGRLKPGVELERASVEMRGISERLAEEYPDSSAGESAEVVGLHEQTVGRARPALTTLFFAVGFVVLIACANVANLLLVRASSREKEVAIRIAMGAAGRRLVFQMLAESLVLAVAGGALGLLLTSMAIPAIQALSADSIPRVADISLDRTVLLFTFGTSVLTGILFGLAPAWQLSKGTTGTILKEGGRSSIAGGRWMRSTLLVAEVALAVVLLVGATLLIRSFDRLTGVDPGFDASGVLAFQIALPDSGYPEDDTRSLFYDTLHERLAALPSVTAASTVQRLPIGGYFLSLEIVGDPPRAPGEEFSAHYRAISPDYFTTLAMPVQRGRTFTPQDTAASPLVAIVDEAFVDRFMPGQDPIGRRINIGNGNDNVEIVGLVGSVLADGLDAGDQPTMYGPVTQDVFSDLWVLVKTAGDPAALSGSVRQVVRDIDGTLPTSSMAPLATIVDDTVAPQRFSMLLLLLFGLVALFLASVGLYGVVAYSVNLRTREIGLRMAIGAMPGDVLGLILRSGMKLALLGVAIGITGALLLSRVLSVQLFDIEPTDPVSYAGTALVLLAVSALACYLPARRATRVDPLVTLQND